MDKFPHLKFVEKLKGKPRLHGGGSAAFQTEVNKNNRQTHYTNLSSATNKIEDEWENFLKSRNETDAPELSPEIIPIYLQINPTLINAEFNLGKLGIEIISEEDDGFILGASLDNLRSLKSKIEGFVDEAHGTGIVADLWKIIEGNRDSWKPEHILTPELFTIWPKIKDTDQFHVEVSIAFDFPLPKAPDPNSKGFERKLKDYHISLESRDLALIERQSNFEKFISNYGSLLSGYVELEDSFGCEVQISGLGLRDLVLNYPFVFEVFEKEEVFSDLGDENIDEESELNILPPDPDSIEVAVIDSGIMEGNKFIAPAVNSSRSKSYLLSDGSVADKATNGGHGTKVAGLILYPNGVDNKLNPYKLPFFIRNLRVLDDQCKLTHSFPAELIKRVVEENDDCRLFNHSINSCAPFRVKHISSWAATIDHLIHTKDILFVVSAGNITKNEVKQKLLSGELYPNYLDEPFCRISNPAQSLFSITVGSIDHLNFEDEDWVSIASQNNVSAYSRVGLGIWKSVKPDLVEFGGCLTVSKDSLLRIKEHEETTFQLVRSTYSTSGPAIGRGYAGTSFSAPKVAHILGHIQRLYPDENINLYRALLVQGAILPDSHFERPTINSLRHFGYGIPFLDKATTNSDHRISYYTTGLIKAEEGHIFSLKIPEVLRDQGNSFDVLIEVTLAFTANIRRTRQKTKSYLSSWVDWSTSKLDEPFVEFKDYALKEIAGIETSYDNIKRNRYRNYSWKLSDRANSGIEDFKRSNSTLQKDWCIVKSFEMSPEIGLIVKCHKGWDNSSEEVPYALVVSIEILGKDIPIYESIRLENMIEVEVSS